jgi:hypothetical protein
MLAAHPEGAGATLALALILVVQGTLFGLLGYVVWKDQGWKPWMGAVRGDRRRLAAFLGEAPHWNLARRRQQGRLAGCRLGR